MGRGLPLVHRPPGTRPRKQVKPHSHMCEIQAARKITYLRSVEKTTYTHTNQSLAPKRLRTTDLNYKLHINQMKRQEDQISIATQVKGINA